MRFLRQSLSESSVDLRQCEGWVLIYNHLQLTTHIIVNFDMATASSWKLHHSFSSFGSSNYGISRAPFDAQALGQSKIIITSLVRIE